MPILDVEIVGDLPGSNLARRIAESAGEVLGARPGGTWVRLRHLPEAHYSESGSGEGARPVFVSLLQFEYKSKAETARGLAEAVAAVTGRPVENVHVLFEPEARGRIAFGGKLRE